MSRLTRDPSPETYVLQPHTPPSVHLCCFACSGRADVSGRSRQLEHQLESVVHGAQLVVCQMADSLSESTRIDGPYHLAKHLRWLVENGDLWVEAGLEGGARRGAYDYGRERQEVVRLDDHRVTPAMLEMPAPSGELDLVDVTTDHAGSP
jgi:hypothetical protein